MTRPVRADTAAVPTLRGVVRDPSGRPVAGARLQVSSRRDRGKATWIETAADGSFEFARPRGAGRSVPLADLVFEYGGLGLAVRQIGDALEVVAERGAGVGPGSGDDRPRVGTAVGRGEDLRQFSPPALPSPADDGFPGVECSFSTGAGRFRERYFGLTPAHRALLRNRVVVRTEGGGRS